ncbi:ring finger domain-containing protein [Sarocladium implicatum]|nr:ring finger domain-containing protein [Sarocladium implicatum]
MPYLDLGKRVDGGLVKRSETGKSAGILVACLVAVLIIVPTAFRLYVCWSRRGGNNERRPSTSSGGRYLDPAAIMRLCALRARLQPQETCQEAMTNEELDAIAPKMLYKDARRTDSLQATSISRPQPAFIRKSPLSRIAEEECHEDETEKQLMEKSRFSTITVPEEHVTPCAIPTDVTGASEHTALCSICLEDYSDEDVVRKTVCGHVFHSPCLTQWLGRPAWRCPLCQGELGLRGI